MRNPHSSEKDLESAMQREETSFNENDTGWE